MLSRIDAEPFLPVAGIAVVSTPVATAQVAVVMGASSGLGLAIARALWQNGYVVIAAARNLERLQAAQSQICGAETGNTTDEAPCSRLHLWQCDAVSTDAVKQFFANIREQFGRLDVLANCVGQSDRGSVAELTPEKLHVLLDMNVVSALLPSQAALPLLKESRGVVVNIGSLAARVGARYLGGYPATKHALSGLTQQMRLEWLPLGVHVAMVNPGPILREDAGVRYSEAVKAQGLPASAAKPGGGTSVKGLSSDWLAKQVLQVIQRRQPDRVFPGWLRLLIALGHLKPSLGDWFLLKKTTSRD